MKRSTARAFTLIELLVVVAIIALLISILLPSLGKAKEMANRVYCAANMTGITKSLILYGSDNADRFPSVPGPSNGANYSVNFPSNATSSLTPDGALVTTNTYQGDPLACLWMLVLNRSTANPKLYICKSDLGAGTPASVTDDTGHYYANFQKPDQISFSVANPWANGGGNGQWWRTTLDTQTPVLSDMAPMSGNSGKVTNSPKGSPASVYNSGNHRDAGQNVSFGDAHVEWFTNPYVGCAGDNIFTQGTNPGSPITTGGQIPNGGISSGSYPYDTVMTPVRNLSNYQVQ